MTTTKSRKIFKTIYLVGLTFALLAGSTAADAQNRDEQWEFTLGTFYQFSNDLEFEGGTTAETDGELGFKMGFGYNMTDKFAVNFGFNYDSVGYNANVIEDDGDSSRISGKMDNWVLSVNAIYHFSDGPLTPYVGAGIGWTWVDTNIPDGLPSTGCWWDPWWGWVCATSYPTKTKSAFFYQATIGLRYEFNYSTFMRFNYSSQWLDFGNATSTPRYDVLGLDIGWMF